MTAVVLALLVASVLSVWSDGDRVESEVPGDIAESVAGMDPDTMPLHAQALLETQRPWRAAQVMRRYLELVPDASVHHRLLAARAEAGWGAWAQVGELLESTPALETHEDGLGLALLARAREERGDLTGAAAAYRAFLGLPQSSESEEQRAAARLRLGLLLTRAGLDEEAAGELRRSAALVGDGAVWIELLTADARSARGDTAGVRQRVARFESGQLGLRAWRARIGAARQAGDLAGARLLAQRARAWARTASTQSEFLVSAARLALAMGDSAEARGALVGAIDRDRGGPYARQAAELLRSGEMGPREQLAVARVLRAQGLHEEALDGYRRWLASREGSVPERAVVQLEYADALFYAERYDEVAAALEPVASEEAARRLRARAAERLGDYDAAVRLYLELARDAGRGAAEPTFLAAAARHDAGELEAARDLYQRVVSRHPTSSQAGLALMRLAGIAFGEGDFAHAAQRWDDYRTSYPRGALVPEATYWSGRARWEMGDTAAARRLFESLRERERDSYYALLASERLGLPFGPLPLAAGPEPSDAAAERVAAWMRALDLFRAAGFPEEASAEADRLVEAVGTDRPTRYALAEALAERGYSQRAIRIGNALRGAGLPDQRLIRILHPLPHRTLIVEEGGERGIDPFIAAALIRQESLFESRATSHAGARGLMQIMPATGRQLAEAAGIEGWDPEFLYHPEINVHLGTRYLAEHMNEYDGSLPAVFAAYNAGPHRVEWWSEFPEYRDHQLFTERIPFRETREYVKILTRNLAIYRTIYGQER